MEERSHELEGARHAASGYLMRRQAGDVLVLKDDRSRCHRQEAGDHVEGRRFARAVWPDQAEHFSLFHGK